MLGRKEMTTFVGIDPGVSGGIAVIHEYGVMLAKFSNKTEADIASLFRSLRVLQPCVAMIEKVHAMPKQGVSSCFTFGRSYGFLRGMLTAHGIRFDEVTPQKWQKAMGCLTKGDKNVSKQRAQQRYPGMASKITHAVADALLIAAYAETMQWSGLDGK
jgi:crossover junction endodeoxyribonuclease RuvC